MIPARPGTCYVRDGYRHEVVAFDDYGYPLVASGGSHLRPLSDGELTDDDRHYVQLLPPGGWRIEYTSVPDGETFDAPLVAWGLTAMGGVVPLEVSPEGLVEPPTEQHDLNYRVYHPFEEERTT